MERQVGPERLGWTERAYASLRLSPAMAGTAIAGVLAFGVNEFALDRHLLLSTSNDHPHAPFLLLDTRLPIVHCLLAAYLPTAYIYLLRGYRGTLDPRSGLALPGHRPARRSPA